MTWKVDPLAEKGAWIFIKESSIKAIALRLRKSSTDKNNFLVIICEGIEISTKVRKVLRPTALE